MRSSRSRMMVVILIAVLAIIGTAHAAEDLDSYLEGVRSRYGLPALAAAVARNGEVVAAGAVGTRVMGMDIPVTVNDRFHLGSDTKAMTATIAGTLVEEGRVAWQTTLGDVLGKEIEGLNPALAAVTLEQLLSHSGGIPSDTPEMMAIYFDRAGFEKNTAALRLDAIARWKHHAPQVPRGSPFQYANFGYLIVGAMLEKVAGKPWERLMVERIYKPLGLASAGLGPQATFGQYDAAIGHSLDDDGKATPMLWGPAADMPPVLGPAGNAHMSILDFARWAGWNAGGGKRAPHIVSPQTLAIIHQPHVKTPPLPDPPPGTPAEGEYGLGWGTVKFDWANEPLLTHNGSNSMNFAKALFDTKLDLAVVVATNIPGKRAEDATAEVQRHLYREFSIKP